MQINNNKFRTFVIRKVYMDNNSTWFESWFDTTYYHTLYKNRNDQEAQLFVKHLIEFLSVDTSHAILDLACGKGRHSIFMNSLGLNVVGLDLSPNNINYASQFSNDRLKFGVHDMRNSYTEHTFDFIFNLFTSFGYFDTFEENARVLSAIYAMLKERGILVIDFFNADFVLENLVPFEVKSIDGIDFEISKRYDGTHIFKDIRFKDKRESFHFTERVQALKKDDFLELIRQTGFELKTHVGDYNLSDFEKHTSERFILIAQKTS